MWFNKVGISPTLRFSCICGLTIVLGSGVLSFKTSRAKALFPVEIPSSQRTIKDRLGRIITLTANGPRRVIPMIPSMAETLLWLGVANRVVGVTEFTDDLREYADRPVVGGPFTPNLEAIVRLQPDLVILARDHNPRSLAEALDRLNIPYLVVKESTLEDVILNLEILGDVFHQPERVRRWIDSFHKMSTCLRQRKWPERPRVLFLLSIKPIYVTGRGAFMTDVIELAGFRVVSKEISNPWPQVSLEQIARWDPDLILMARSHARRIFPVLRSHPAWRSIRAVQNNHLKEVDDRILRPTPYLVMMIFELIRQIHPTPRVGLECLPEGSMK